MNDSLKKVTIITGSGFTVGNKFGCPSTFSLTKGLRNLDFENLEINGLNPGEYFYRLLCNYYKVDPEGDYTISLVNFETIIHLVEILHSYYHSTDSDTNSDNESELNKTKRLTKYVGISPSVMVLKPKIVVDFENTFISNNKLTKIYELFDNIFVRFNNYIKESIETFSNDESNEGMLGFNEGFIKRYLSDSINRFYTLNYDDWINRHLDFFDGFDTNGKFITERVLTQKNENSHYNLHGCIFWINALPPENIKKIIPNYNLNIEFRMVTNGLDRQPLIPTPIISGYNKLQRMKYAPYASIYYALQRDLIETDILLIIGYSFSDTHINNILSTTSGKVVICTNIDSDGSKDEYINKLRRIFGGTSNNFNKKDDIYTLASGRIKIWTKGIGEDFYKNWNKLIK